MAIIIKKAEFKDLEPLYSIEKECFTIEAFSKKQIAALLQNPKSTNFLAKMDGETVGFIIALTCERRGEKVGHILTVNVAAKARKKGVGFELLKKMEKTLREKGIRVCYLEVKTDNVEAHKLYKKLGYIETKLLKGFYPQGDGVRMKKTLQ
ncbi:MAG: ribosomal protein S18-alanine N-acetyltransferase [Candidatus Bathyarchaeia archaeon]